MGISIFAAFTYTTNLAPVVIPAIGATIVDLIAATSLFIYRKALIQLNLYYASLHNNERFLSIVHLVSKVSSERQDEIYMEIITNQLKSIDQDMKKEQSTNLH